MDAITGSVVLRMAIGVVILLFAIMSLLSGEILLGRRGRFRIGGFAGQILSVVYALIGVALILTGLVNVVGGLDEETEAVISVFSCLGGVALLVISVLVILIAGIVGGGQGERRR